MQPSPARPVHLPPPLPPCSPPAHPRLTPPPRAPAEADGVSALTVPVPVDVLLAAGAKAGSPACEGLAPGKPVTVSGVMRGGVGKRVDVMTKTSRMPLDPCNDSAPASGGSGSGALASLVKEGTALLATFELPGAKKAPKPARRLLAA